jgi:Tfp pilus assembly protein PilO
MTAKRLFWLLLGVLVLLFAGLIGAVYGTTGLVKSKSAQLADSRATVEQLNTQQTGLVKSKQDITKYADLEKITQAVVPQDKDQAETVRELAKIAANNRITLTTISFPDSNLGSDSTSVSAGSKSKKSPSQLTPVPDIPGVYNLQITIANSTTTPVTFNQLSAFLQDLENNRRTAAVSSVNIAPQKGNSEQLVFTLIINTYIKPAS